jgi:hypothetical protein
VEETTLKAAVDKFGPAGSINTYYDVLVNVVYDYYAGF